MSQYVFDTILVSHDIASCCLSKPSFNLWRSLMTTWRLNPPTGVGEDDDDADSVADSAALDGADVTDANGKQGGPLATKTVIS